MRMDLVFRELKRKLEGDEDEHFPGDELFALNSKGVLNLVEEMLQLGLLDVVELGGEDEAVGGAQLPVLLVD